VGIEVDDLAASRGSIEAGADAVEVVAGDGIEACGAQHTATIAGPREDLVDVIEALEAAAGDRRRDGRE
jgi:hypothetical protein